jgi:photosystem II stability/assembly factor-like uncharacterized protein
MAVAPGIQLDPLIGEARRRARRRRLALLVVALAGAGAGIGVWRLTGGAPASTPVANAARITAVARTTFIGDAGLSGGVGWSMNALGFWVTRDGGSTWITATPKHVRAAGDVFARIDQVEFIDRDHGWLTAGDVFGGFPLPKNAPTWRHMEIDRTTDGGRTWHASAPPGCLQACGETHVSFLDPKAGFAIASKGLFATHDGGATWTRVSRPPFVGPIDFLDARSGFGVSDPTRWGGPQYATPIGGGIPYRTSDGGRTWSRVRVAAPAAYAGWGAVASAVQFFGRQGVLAVRFRDPRTHVQRLVVYTSTDGGSSWAAHFVPARVRWSLSFFTWGVPASGLFSAASPRAWVMNGNRVLFATTDGGRSWRTVRPLDLPRRATIWSVQFTAPDDGWAIFWLPKGDSGSGALVRTSDGGSTWTPLAPPVPKLRPLPKPKAICGSGCRQP